MAHPSRRRTKVRCFRLWLYNADLANMRDRKAPQDEVRFPQVFTNGQLPSDNGRHASSTGIVRATVNTSHGPVDSSGFFVANRYIGCSLRPSTRTDPLPKIGSSVGIAFIASTSFLPSAALFVCAIAFIRWIVAEYMPACMSFGILWRGCFSPKRLANARDSSLRSQ